MTQIKIFKIKNKMSIFVFYQIFTKIFENNSKHVIFSEKSKKDYSQTNKIKLQTIKIYQNKNI